MAPGVTYQNNGDTWREIFHYPTDGSPQPPEAGPPATAAHLASPATPTLTRMIETSTRASVEALRSEWDNGSGHDRPSEEISGGMQDAETANITNLSRMSGLLEGHLSYNDSTQPSVGPDGEDTTELFVTQGGVNNLTLSSPLPLDLGDRDPSVDEFVNSNSSSLANTTTEYKGLVSPTSDNNDSEYLVPKSSNQQDNNPVVLKRGYMMHEYVMSATITAFLSVPTLPTVRATQEQHSYSSMEYKANDNSSLTPISNDTNNDSYVMPIADDKNTSPSHPAKDNLPTMHPTQRLLQDQVEYDDRPTTTSRDIEDEVVWIPKNPLSGAESTDGGPLRDVMTLTQPQASGHSMEHPQPPRHSTEQIYTQSITLQPASPEVSEKHVPATLPALFVPTGRARPTVIPRPETTSTRVLPAVSTIFARPAAPTLSTQTLLSDITAGKSSSQVT